MARPKKTAQAEATSVEDLVAQIEALKAQLAERSSKAVDADGLTKEDLTQALLVSRESERAARRLAEQVAEEEVYEVTNLSNSMVEVVVRDKRGEPKSFLFERKGARHLLTASQILELSTEHPKVFDNGILYAPDVIPTSPNAIEDYDAFLASIPTDEIGTRLDQITSADVLITLFHHIDNQRFVEVEQDGKRTFQRQDLDHRLQTLQYAIADRVVKKTNMRLMVDHA